MLPCHERQKQQVRHYSLSVQSNTGTAQGLEALSTSQIILALNTKWKMPLCRFPKTSVGEGSLLHPSPIPPSSKIFSLLYYMSQMLLTINLIQLLGERI